MKIKLAQNKKSYSIHIDNLTYDQLDDIMTSIIINTEYWDEAEKHIDKLFDIDGRLIIKKVKR